jgi:Ca2+-binding RTX toxin-like protein
VTGTRKADELHVDLNGTSGQIDVSINGAAAGSFDPAALTGGIHVNAGGGNDTVVIGPTVTLATVIRGGKGNDSLTGGGGSDDIDGESGRDTVDGGAGDDTVHGGAGGDDVSGGADDDTVRGDAGADTVRGGDGSDDLDGGAGSDDCDGEAGDDRVTGERGRDRVRGGLGDDTVDGGSGGDDVGGDDGNDAVNGNDGTDSCDGGNGDDTVDGGRGRDHLRGGAGRDDFGNAFDDDNDADREIEDRADDDAVHVAIGDAPAAVQTAFATQFPGATIRQVERENEDAGIVYKIDFLNAQSQRQRATFTEAGTFVGVESRDGGGGTTVGAGHNGQQIPADQLPQAVRAAFDARYPGATIGEVERENEDSGVFYMIDFTNSQSQRLRATFSEAGTFVKEEAPGGGGSGDTSGGGDNSGGVNSGGGDNPGGGDHSGGDNSGDGGNDDGPGRT